MSLDKMTITLSSGGNSVTMSGNKFDQAARSLNKPNHPCRFCGKTKWEVLGLIYFRCAACHHLAGWRKGDED